MKKEDVKVGGIYYFNNRSVLIQREEANGVFFALASDELELKIKGEDFCTACIAGHMDGTTNVHVCDEYDDVISEIIEEIGKERITPLWIPARYLREYPFEYKAYETLSKEIEKAKIEIEELKTEKINLKSDNYQGSKTIERKNKEIGKLLEQVDELKDEINDLKELKSLIKRLVPNTTVNISNPNINFSIEDLISLTENKILLGIYNSSEVSKTINTSAFSKVYKQEYGELNLREVALLKIMNLINSPDD